MRRSQRTGCGGKTRVGSIFPIYSGLTNHALLAFYNALRWAVGAWAVGAWAGYQWGRVRWHVFRLV